MESWWIWKTRLVSNMEHMSESNNGMEWMVNPFSITLVTCQKSIQHMIIQNDLYNNVMLWEIVTKCMRVKWFTIKGRWFLWDLREMNDLKGVMCECRLWCELEIIQTHHFHNYHYNYIIFVNFINLYSFINTFDKNPSYLSFIPSLYYFQ